MLQLEHLNLVVRDIPAAIAFYQAAFPHWHQRDSGTSEWSGKSRRWVHFGDDYQYLTFNDNGVGDNRDLAGHQTGLAHFAFVCTNLDALKERLAQAGFSPAKAGADEPHRKNIYYIDPNDFEVEFVEYLSDIPAQRNLSS
jgi:predicted enzyme related to lactoylglutathione lyase